VVDAVFEYFELSDTKLRILRMMRSGVDFVTRPHMDGKLMAVRDSPASSIPQKNSSVSSTTILY
jgi:hypothetical protein